jgi:hypothetical protein
VRALPTGRGEKYPHPDKKKNDYNTIIKQWAQKAGIKICRYLHTNKWLFSIIKTMMRKVSLDTVLLIYRRK